MCDVGTEVNDEDGAFDVDRTDFSIHLFHYNPSHYIAASSKIRVPVGAITLYRYPPNEKVMKSE